MSTADEYRRYAAECMALAERLADLADKSRLVQMAQAFLDLAARRDKAIPNPRQMERSAYLAAQFDQSSPGIPFIQDILCGSRCRIRNKNGESPGRGLAEALRRPVLCVMCGAFPSGRVKTVVPRSALFSRSV